MIDMATMRFESISSIRRLGLFILAIFCLSCSSVVSFPLRSREQCDSKSFFDGKYRRYLGPLCSSKMNDENRSLQIPSWYNNTNIDPANNNSVPTPSIFHRFRDEIPFIHLFTELGRKKLPPIQVDDANVLLYDVFLIVNLSLSVSFWVIHRFDFASLPLAFNEGCLFSILWIISGLYHGAFLYSAIDGHYPIDEEKGRGGPKDAAALAFNTFINATNLRLVAALVGAWMQHRKVGMDGGMEELIPLEIGYGLVLMTLWRALHSSFTPRA